MRITQGTFSFLPDLSDEQISKQPEYCLNKGWALAIEYTDDPHPRNTYWEMFGLPMFDLHDAAMIMFELANCRKTFANYYIRVTAFDSSQGVDPLVMAAHCESPRSRTRLSLGACHEDAGRTIRYSIESYVRYRPSLKVLATDVYDHFLEFPY